MATKKKTKSTKAMLSVYFTTTADLQKVKRAAKKRGVKTSAFMRGAVMAAASRALT